mmetsp:Transcript_42701/g.65541  ORF Transcript_42701/g.65541 Transcript_42701/m.65541 type:complete len:219 (-) Transcript_42701:1352-2008(-)
MSLEVEELQVIGPLIPLVLIVVHSWTRKGNLLHIVSESLVRAELQVLAQLRLEGDFLLLVHVAARTDVPGGSLVDLSQARLDRNLRRTSVIVLTGEQHEVVGCSTLELFVRDGLVFLDAVLTDTWVVLAHDNIVESLVNSRTVRSELLLGHLHLAAVRQLVSTSSRHAVLVLLKSDRVNSEGLLFTTDSLVTLTEISYVLLRTWNIKHVLIDTQIISF